MSFSSRDGQRRCFQAGFRAGAIGSRRELLRGAAASAAVAALSRSHGWGNEAAAEGLPTVRPLTRGPKFHWFGYYDKLQFSHDNRYILSNEVDFEHRSPTGDDKIAVGMVDTADGDRWIPLGETGAWNWQQGCMLQWLPGSKSEVYWNDRETDRFVAHLLDVETGKRRTIDSAIYCVSPDGKTGIAPDFARLNHCRPGYGYAGVPDDRKHVAAPDDGGLWTIDLATGERRLLFSLREAAEIPYTGRNAEAFRTTPLHWFNHLLFNTDGTRFFFLHRWRLPRGGFGTRAFTANRDGSDLFVLDPHGHTSHFIWRDAEHVMAYSWHPSHGAGFYLYRDRTDEVTPVAHDGMTENGHNTYVPGTDNQWVLNDTYPDPAGLQHPYLYHLPTDRRVPLGHFASPQAYRGEWRCDTHPRSSRDGRLVCIDSPHQEGRQMYLIDVAGIVG